MGTHTECLVEVAVCSTRNGSSARPSSAAVVSDRPEIDDEIDLRIELVAEQVNEPLALSRPAFPSVRAEPTKASSVRVVEVGLPCVAAPMTPATDLRATTPEPVPTVRRVAHAVPFPRL